MRTRYARRAWLVIAAFHVSACVSWRPEPVPQSGSRAAKQLPSQVRVVTADGRTMTIRDPMIVGDSLVGVESRGRETSASIHLALADIRELEARRPDMARSMAMTVVVIFATLGAVAILLSGEET